VNRGRLRFAKKNPCPADSSAALLEEERGKRKDRTMLCRELRLDLGTRKKKVL